MKSMLRLLVLLATTLVLQAGSCDDASSLDAEPYSLATYEEAKTACTTPPQGASAGKAYKVRVQCDLSDIQAPKGAGGEVGFISTCDGKRTCRLTRDVKEIEVCACLPDGNTPRCFNDDKNPANTYGGVIGCVDVRNP